MSAVTVLAGGDAVYVFRDLSHPGVAELVAVQRGLIEVAYPADETLVRRVGEERWAAVEAELREDGVTVVDCRELGQRPAAEKGEA